MTNISSADTATSEFSSLDNQTTYPTLLIVEDDQVLRERLAKALERRGFEVATAESVGVGLSLIEQRAHAFAVVDMKLGDGNGLEIISALKRRQSDARAVVLTGYGNIASAVNAVKAGAIDYLAKPADADDVMSALLAQKGGRPRRRCIRCQRHACDGNTSKVCTICARGMCPRLHGVSICIEEPCNAFWQSGRPCDSTPQVLLACRRFTRPTYSANGGNQMVTGLTHAMSAGRRQISASRFFVPDFGRCRRRLIGATDRRETSGGCAYHS